MSKLSDELAATEKELDDAIVRVQEDVAGLDAKIVELETLIAEGTATQADYDMLARIKAKAAALDPKKPETL